MESEHTSESQHDLGGLPVDFTRAIHFQGQTLPLLPWEVLLTEAERDTLDDFFENSEAEVQGERPLKFRFVPSGKDLFGTKNILVLPPQAKYPPIRAVPKTPSRAGTYRGAKRASGSTSKTSTTGGERPSDDIPPGLTLASGWRNDALDIVDEVRQANASSWEAILSAPGTLPFYNDIIEDVALTFNVIEMKLASTKELVKEMNAVATKASLESSSRHVIGYTHSFRWLTDMRRLFYQQFVYLQRVAKKDINRCQVLPSTTHAKPYPTPQELDLMEVDLTHMVQQFERFVSSKSSLNAYCRFEADSTDRRLAPKPHASESSGIDEWHRSRYHLEASAPHKRPPETDIIGREHSSPPPAKRKAVTSPIKPSIPIIPLKKVEAEPAPPSRIPSPPLSFLPQGKDFSLKGNSHIPVETPHNSAFELPELPQIPGTSPAGNAETAKKKSNQQFADLDVMYRYAALNTLSFDLGIHPTVAAADISFKPDLELLLPEQVYQYIAWVKWLFNEQQKMTKQYNLPVTLATDTKASRESRLRALGDSSSDQEIVSTSHSKSSKPIPMGSLATITAPQTTITSQTTQKTKASRSRGKGKGKGVISSSSAPAVPPKMPGPSSMVGASLEESSSISSSVSLSMSDEEDSNREMGLNINCGGLSNEISHYEEQDGQRESTNGINEVAGMDQEMMSTNKMEQEEEDIERALLGSSDSLSPSNSSSSSIKGPMSSDDPPSLGFASNIIPGSGIPIAPTTDEEDELNGVEMPTGALGSVSSSMSGQSRAKSTWRTVKTAALHESYCNESEVQEEEDEHTIIVNPQPLPPEDEDPSDGLDDLDDEALLG